MGLICTKKAIPRISQTRYYILVGIQVIIQCSGIYFHIMMPLTERFYTLRSTNDTHTQDSIGTKVFESVHCSNNCAASSQHGIQYYKSPFLCMVRDLEIIIHRLVGFMVPFHTYVTYPGIRDKFQHALHHAKAGP